MVLKKNCTCAEIDVYMKFQIRLIIDNPFCHGWARAPCTAWRCLLAGNGRMHSVSDPFYSSENINYQDEFHPVNDIYRTRRPSTALDHITSSLFHRGIPLVLDCYPAGISFSLHSLHYFFCMQVVAVTRKKIGRAHV